MGTQPVETGDQTQPAIQKEPINRLTAPPRINRRANGPSVQTDETRLCVVMVGLPARGKSLIASKGIISIRAKHYMAADDSIQS